jgi:CheY-like chemotaxis protein
VATAPDGAAAVERLAAGEDADVVLMDMTMPRMNGLEAVGALRARGVGVPVILMSGYSAEEIEGRGASAGIDGFLKKPFAAADLRAALAAVTAGVGAEASR